MATTFTLGLWALFADPSDEQPGGYCRDELLFHVRNFGTAPARFYELREVLSADLPMASGSETDRGDLVVMAGDGVGGPLLPAAAEHLLEVWDETPQRATVSAAAATLGLTPRAIIVPDGYAATDIPAGRHPFAGIRVTPVQSLRDAVRAVADDGEAADVIAMLTLCAVHGFVLAACEV